MKPAFEASIASSAGSISAFGVFLKATYVVAQWSGNSLSYNERQYYCHTETSEYDCIPAKTGQNRESVVA